jgi:predicted DNA-binding transcriptional regulator AlpA
MDDHAPSPLPLHDRLLPWADVRPIAGISRTTAWRLQNIGDFPRPVMLSPGRVGWRESEVRAWRASRVPRGEPPPAPLFDPCVAPGAKPSPPAGHEPSTGPPAAAAEPPTRRRPSPRRKRANGPDQLSFNF